jgi:hypothetical protein
MNSNERSLNYRALNLFMNYNFGIRCVSIRDKNLKYVYLKQIEDTLKNFKQKTHEQRRSGWSL